MTFQAGRSQISKKIAFQNVSLCKRSGPGTAAQDVKGVCELDRHMPIAGAVAYKREGLMGLFTLPGTSLG